MNTPPLITLTSDFEERDPFVASVKGVIYSRCPDARVVDLSHDVPRGDVMEGALFVAKAIPCFPAGSIHMVAVACGAPPIMVKINDQTIVCPDNGIVSLLAQHHEIEAARSVPVPSESISGGQLIMFARDVFAPTVARLAAEAEFADIGDAQDGVHLLELSRPAQRAKDCLRGQIIHVDRYGNLVTNIYRSALENVEVRALEVGNLLLEGLSSSYLDVPAGKPLALFGSSDYLEIAYNGDRADERLSIGKGIVVDVWTK